MKINLLTIILFSTIVSNFFGQAEREPSPLPKNSINLNLLGDASWVSLGYERILSPEPEYFLTSKVGVGYNNKQQLCFLGPCSYVPENYLTIPHHITGNMGNGKHYFEIGVGGTYFTGKSGADYLLYPMIGYRLMAHETSNGSLRVFAYLPIVKSGNLDFIFIPIGLNLGLLF